MSDTETEPIADEMTPDEDDEINTDGDDETPEEEIEAEPGIEDEGHSPMTEKEIEQGLAKLNREAQRHESRVREIMGADFDGLLRCELCDWEVPGFRFPAEVDDEKRAHVLEAIGMGAWGERVHDPDCAQCDYCQGFGETLTGSRVIGSETRPCPKCQAKGWTTPDDRKQWEGRVGAQRAAADLGIGSQAPTPTFDALPATDAWTRPLGHPFYGKNPQYMTPAERSADWEGARVAM